VAEVSIPREAVEAGARALADWLNLDYDRIGDGQATLTRQADAMLKGAAPHIAAVHANRINRLTAQRDEARRALTRVMPAARTAEEVQADAGAIRFSWGPRFAALLEDLLDEDDLLAVLAAWETLLREQVTAHAALEAVTSPRGAQS
jgi:hypothetical protein